MKLKRIIAVFLVLLIPIGILAFNILAIIKSSIFYIILIFVFKYN